MFPIKIFEPDVARPDRWGTSVRMAASRAEPPIASWSPWQRYRSPVCTSCLAPITYFVRQNATVLAPEIQLVCEENVTTAQNDHSLYSSIDGSNSRSIMRFSLCWPQHEWKTGAPPGSDVSASGRIHVMGQTDKSILNNFPYLLHISIHWNWHTRKIIISLKR